MKVLLHVSLKYHLTKNDILAQFDNIVFFKKNRKYLYIFPWDVLFFKNIYIKI